MKYRILILFFVGSFQLWAQNSIPIDTIVDYGVTLRKNWKWQFGDNLTWANPTFNDQSWPKFDTNKSIHVFPKLRKVQIGWFRRPIKVSSALVRKTFYIDIQQMGASEIFLDGKLLHKIGVVSTNPTLEKTQVSAQFLPISFPDTNQHLLAVRFSFTRANFYIRGTSKNIFKITLNDVVSNGDFLFRKTKQITGMMYFCIGLFLVFCMLHFLFYNSNRQQKVSFWLGFTMLSFAIAFFSYTMEESQNQITYQQINELITYISFYVGIILINVSLYRYLSQPFSLFFYIQTALMFSSVICYIFGLDFPFSFQTWGLFLLILIDFIRVSLLAEKRRNPNAKVPIYSLIAVAVCIGLLILAGVVLTTIEPLIKDIESILIVVLGAVLVLMFLSIPVGLSFSLVSEYSKTHRALRKNIQEIEALSAKNLAHEQEKQQILANQNETLEHQVNERTIELQNALESLKATQDQLIQSEKLASLGELTAGIAHEIQNPLNFVNNFSEVSQELVEDVLEERKKEDKIRDEELIDELLSDLSQNQAKINHHGKRASSIVTGMLQHSRTSTGERELTDINALADEYLRLSYHGLRAKNNNFQADYQLIANLTYQKSTLFRKILGGTVKFD
ncbi:MAG: histidine kinase dimerization/phospho-acceptor domain-containing protein [Spirosomataceae bacterium]